MLANYLTVDDALAAIEVLPGTLVLVFTLPDIDVGRPGATVSSMIVPMRTLTDAMFSNEPRRQIIVSMTPIYGTEAQLNKEQFEGWVADVQARAQAEDGDGFLIGVDPLNPVERISAADLGLADDRVFNRSRADGATLFEWSEVGAFSAKRGSLTAEIYLVDGGSVFIHADVDWYNRINEPLYT